MPIHRPCPLQLCIFVKLKPESKPKSGLSNFGPVLAFDSLFKQVLTQICQYFRALRTFKAIEVVSLVLFGVRRKNRVEVQQLAHGFFLIVTHQDTLFILA